nr:glycosyltransferase family 39 protein [Mesorhizobium sp.]
MDRLALRWTGRSIQRRDRVGPRLLPDADRGDDAVVPCRGHRRRRRRFRAADGDAVFGRRLRQLAAASIHLAGDACGLCGRNQRPCPQDRQIWLAGGGADRLFHRLGYSNRAAAAGMFGLLLFPQIFWEMQHALAHSVAIFCFTSVLLLALVEVEKRRSAVAYAFLGLATAAAMLSKYNIIIFLAALFLASLSVRETREAIFDRRFLISVAVAILACLPTLYWSLTHLDDLLSHQGGLGVAKGGSIAKTALLGIRRLANAIVNFAGLPVAIFAVAYGLATRKQTEPPQPVRWPEKLLWRAIVLGLVVMVTVVLAAGITQFRDRWMLPIFILLPAALAMRFDAMGQRGRKTQATIVFVGALLAVLVLPLSWYMHLHGGDSRGGVVRMDYRSLYEQINADGPVKTVVSSWFWVGNLRLVDADLIALDDETPDFARSIREPAVLVLTDDRESSSDVFEELARAGYAMDTVHRTVEVPQALGFPPRKVTITKLHKKIAP